MPNRCSKWIAIAIVITHIITVSIPPASAAQFTVFNKTYVRATGAPKTVNDTFSVLNTNTTWTMKAINGSLEDDTIEKVSSSVSSLNGIEILKPNQFNQNIALIEETVGVNPSNTIATEVRGKPGGQLTIQIVGKDETPPSVSWLMPSEGQFFNAQSIAAEIKFIEDISGLDPASLQILLDNVSVLTNFSPLTQPTLSATLQGNLSVVEGVHTFNAQIKNLAGLLANASVSFTVDRTPPVISSLIPTEGSIFSTATPTLSANFSDNLSGIKEDSIQVLLDGGNITQQTNASAVGFHFVTPALTDGNHTLLISVDDKAGNNTQTEIHFTTDTSPPFISGLTPADGTTVDNAQPTISVNYHDLASGIDIQSVRLKLDGDDVTSLSTVSATSINFSPLSELTQLPQLEK